MPDTAQYAESSNVLAQIYYAPIRYGADSASSASLCPRWAAKGFARHYTVKMRTKKALFIGESRIAQGRRKVKHKFKKSFDFSGAEARLTGDDPPDRIYFKKI